MASLELRGYGDPSSNAEAMALKTAAAKFGLGLYLHSRRPGPLMTKGGQWNTRFHRSRHFLLIITSSACQSAVIEVVCLRRWSGPIRCACNSAFRADRYT
jgi:hypothetical protein